MKILLYLIAIAVVVGGVVLLLGGKKTAEAPAVVTEESVPEQAVVPEPEALPEEKTPAFPAMSLYNSRGFLDCSYFWNDVRAACPEVKNTKWNSPKPWDINAGLLVCRMKALGSDEGDFDIGVSRADEKRGQSAEEIFNTGKAGFKTLGYQIIDVPGIGDSAYTPKNPVFQAPGYNLTAKKGAWVVDITSGNPEFCVSKLETQDVVQRILRKLP